MNNKQQRAFADMAYDALNLESFVHDVIEWVSNNLPIEEIYGGGWVADSANVSATAYVGPDAQVSGSAWVSGNAQVSGSAWVSGDARVSGDDIWTISSIGSRLDTLTIFRTKDGWQAATGCWLGTLDELEKAVVARHGERSLFGEQYAAAVHFANRMIALYEENKNK